MRSPSPALKTPENKEVCDYRWVPNHWPATLLLLLLLLLYNFELDDENGGETRHDGHDPRARGSLTHGWVARAKSDFHPPRSQYSRYVQNFT